MLEPRLELMLLLSCCIGGPSFYIFVCFLYLLVIKYIVVYIFKKREQHEHCAALLGRFSERQAEPGAGTHMGLLRVEKHSWGQNVAGNASYLESPHPNLQNLDPNIQLA